MHKLLTLTHHLYKRYVLWIPTLFFFWIWWLMSLKLALIFVVIDTSIQIAIEHLASIEPKPKK